MGDSIPANLLFGLYNGGFYDKFITEFIAGGFLMKQTITYGVTYGAFFLIAATVTYFVKDLLYLSIAWTMFIVADGPPGFLSEESKLFYCVGVPVFYSLISYALYYVYCGILKNFKINLKLGIGIVFHIAVAVYLIWNTVPIFFSRY